MYRGRGKQNVLGNRRARRRHSMAVSLYLLVFDVFGVIPGSTYLQERRCIVHPSIVSSSPSLTPAVDS